MSIAGLRILVLEDEPIIALTLEDLLIDGGATPMLAASLEAAARLIEQNLPDAALLDVNVQGEKSYPLAQRLRDQGVPFIFASGYGDALHGDEFADVPTIAKPYSLADIEKALSEARR